MALNLVLSESGATGLESSCQTRNTSSGSMLSNNVQDRSYDQLGLVSHKWLAKSKKT